MQEQHFGNAADLWEYLSPTKRPADSEDEVIYRGHANAAWELVPTILRPQSANLLQELVGRPLKCEDQSWQEFQLLRAFVHGCDEMGVRVPNDSLKFRNTNLKDRHFKQYHDFPSTWPNEELLESMALARLHGLPTRLLDWTTNPYVAVYFAACGALRKRLKWEIGQKLAVIEFNKGPVNEDYFSGIRVLRVRGSISRHIVAQQGLFTVHPLFGKKGEQEPTKSLEKYLPESRNSSIRKLTVPVKECVGMYRLCDKFSYNSARLYPSADGASMSAMDNIFFTLADRPARA